MNRIRRFRYRTMYHRMTIEEMRKHEWVVSWSGGKDSTATIILMHENRIPIKEIIYIRMMFDDDLPATLPLMTDFVDRASEVFTSWGYKVNIIPSEKTGIEMASRNYQRSKYTDRNGKPYGITSFLRGFCNMTSVKQSTIQKVVPKDEYEMIGYAADEVERIFRLNCSKRYSIMVQLNIQEIETFDICKSYDLLSPLYDLKISRDGCWFCPNSAKREREIIRSEYPELAKKINELIKMSDYNIESVLKYGRNHWVDDYFAMMKRRWRYREKYKKK